MRSFSLCRETIGRNSTVKSWIDLRTVPARSLVQRLHTCFAYGPGGPQLAREQPLNESPAWRVSHRADSNSDGQTKPADWIERIASSINRSPRELSPCISKGAIMAVREHKKTDLTEENRNPIAGGKNACLGVGAGATVGGAVKLSRACHFLMMISCLISFAGSVRAGKPESMRVCVVRSLFRDVPESLVNLSIPPFRALVLAETGLDSTVLAPLPHDQLADRLANGDLQIGVFQGVEFAWAQRRHPELTALAIGVNHVRNRHGYLIADANSSWSKWEDLAGKSLAIPCCSKEHCLLFAARHCRVDGKEFPQMLSEVTAPPTAEDALDDVVDGLVQAAVVDGVALTAYERRKPGRFARLKVLFTSECFPDSVVAYRSRSLDKVTLRRLQKGLTGANKSLIGRNLLTLWSLTEFEPVPPEFDRLLLTIARAYPPPALSYPKLTAPTKVLASH
jgi:ABC-type phosphate/phosphonate transport system substrate-binding protein